MSDGYGRTRIEKDHGHCADVLMSDYGLPKNLRIEVCHEIVKIWGGDMNVHDFIIAAVRGYLESPRVEPLKQYLDSKKTHDARNQNPGFPPKVIVSLESFLGHE